MKIALIQQRATRDKRLNIERGLANLETAARNGAKLACYAELASSGFIRSIRRSAMYATLPSRWTARWSGRSATRRGSLASWSS
jgi:predicted amidohydrolase